MTKIINHANKLLKEWNASIVGVLNAEYVLDSSRTKQLAESFEDNIYARIHRFRESLVLEIREKGSMYASCYMLQQDFNELEKEYEEFLKNRI